MENIATDSLASQLPPKSAFPVTNSSANENYEPVPVNVKTLLDAGAHFGHQSYRWNPKMLPYIFGEKNGIHIINLDLTVKLWARARKFVVDTLSRGGTILFVGTKQQARELVHAEALRAGAFHVTTRWLGGTLSNFQTIKKSLDRMKKLEDLLAAAANPESKVRITKKEQLTITRELQKLEANIGGIRLMRKVPDVLFVVDVTKEHIAVAEARRLHIPVVALVDTNADPSHVAFPIPCNDDAARTVKLVCAGIADAVIEGRTNFASSRPKEEAMSAEQQSKLEEGVPREHHKGAKGRGPKSGGSKSGGKSGHSAGAGRF